MSTMHIRGKVASGHKLGHKLGFPTANIDIDSGTDIEDGVYAGRVTIDGQAFGAVINIGRNPSVEAHGRRKAEAHIFNFERDIYGLDIDMELVEFLRGERKFVSLEALSAQIAADKVSAQRILEELETKNKIL